MAVATNRRSTHPVPGPRRAGPPLRLVIQRPPDTVTQDLVTVYRPRAGALSRRIADRIGRDVAAFRDPRLQGSIVEALDAAVDLFIDALAGAPVRGGSVATLYRDLGRMEAQAGRDLDAMRAAHHIATQESWAELITIARELDLSLVAVSHLAGSLLDYQRQLLDHALRGFAEPPRPPDPRIRLFATLAGAGDGDLARLAVDADWPLPEAVAVATTAPGPVAAELVASSGTVLTGTRDDMLVLVGPPHDVRQRAGTIAAATGRPVAISWDVAPEDARHAIRWGQRALQLVEEQVLEPASDGIVWCIDHQSELCLHADPVLRRAADEQLLAPLLAESPKRRAALAETMLVWLQTRHTAPAVARCLQVHEQTVRLRLKRIKELFGDRLTDPNETVGLLSALESTTPRWRRDAAC